MGHLEVACFNGESAVRAAAAGVHRIELCSDRTSGGITPSLALLKELRSQISGSIPINVMIRPRAGDFTYSEAELQVMRSSIRTMKPHCDGFVFGVLNEDKTVDVEISSQLVQLARPLPCTFHRAFDDTPDALKALEDVISCGFKTILTSGKPGNAVGNMSVILQLLYATGRTPCPKTSITALARIISLALAGEVVIMAGGGLRSKEIATMQISGIQPAWYHTSAIVDNGEIADEKEMYACRIQAEKGHV